MQNYKCMGEDYPQEDQLEFDNEKLKEAERAIGSDIPEFLKDKHREDIIRLKNDIEERTALLSKQKHQSRGLLGWDMFEKATGLTTEEINAELNKILDK